MDAATANIFGPMNVRSCWIVLALVCKLNGCNNSQQCWTCNALCNNIDKLKEFEQLYCDTRLMLKETTCFKCAWPQQCWKSCANGSNIIVLCFSDHGAKEMLGVADSKVWPVSTTCNRVCKWTLHVTSNNVGSYWPTMLHHLHRALTADNL